VCGEIESKEEKKEGNKRNKIKLSKIVIP